MIRGRKKTAQELFQEEKARRQSAEKLLASLREAQEGKRPIVRLLKQELEKVQGEVLATLGHGTVGPTVPTVPLVLAKQVGISHCVKLLEDLDSRVERLSKRLEIDEEKPNEEGVAWQSAMKV